MKSWRRAGWWMSLATTWGVGIPAQARSPTRPVHTYSIVARDPQTGALGVAVQSHWFSVGTLVTWAEAGVGAVATQSFVDAGYGPRALALLRSGLSASQALRALVSVDKQEAVRQVAIVDAKGRVATHTGARCIDAAGHVTGEGFSVQANMMANDKVVPAMAAAYRGAQGDLAERLLAALEAAQGAGGDVRGKQSAALLVVRARPTGQPWKDRLVDLRIEDHAHPVRELRRLLLLHRAYQEMNRGDDALTHKDAAGALAHYAAAAKLVPHNLEVAYWNAVTLATNGKLDDALPIFRRVFAAEPRWVSLTRRLHKPGVVPDTKAGRALLERILSVAPGPAPDPR